MTLHFISDPYSFPSIPWNPPPGAGDCFRSAFAVALVEGRPLQDRAWIGNVDTDGYSKNIKKALFDSRIRQTVGKASIGSLLLDHFSVQLQRNPMNAGLENPLAKWHWLVGSLCMYIWFVIAIGPGMLEVCSSSWRTHSSLEQFNFSCDSVMNYVCKLRWKAHKIEMLYIEVLITFKITVCLKGRMVRPVLVVWSICFLFQSWPLREFAFNQVSITRAAFKSHFNQPLAVYLPQILLKIDMSELHPSSGLTLWRRAEFAFQRRARDFREVGSMQMLMIMMIT